MRLCAFCVLGSDLYHLEDLVGLGVLVDLRECLRVGPPTGSRYVLGRKVAALGRPQASVRATGPPTLSRPLRPSTGSRRVLAFLGATACPAATSNKRLLQSR